MKEEDYPYLYKITDAASRNAQFYYINGIRTYLILLVIGAIFAFLKPFLEFPIFWFTTVIFVIGLGLLLIQAFKRYDEIWYNGRAVAESVKTRTFRYIMKAAPYNESDAHFVQDLKDILKDNKVISENSGIDSDFDVVTAQMKKVRGMNLEDRKTYYLQYRIDEQRSWYAKKANWNKKQGTFWLGIMIVTNVIALVFSISFAVLKTDYSLSIEPLLVIASVSLSWAQAKRFRELGSAYSLTVHEISLIREESARIATEEKFSDFVNDSENAFSREHTQWVARRKS
ncbi:MULTISPECIES: DUF4231 domain-containing protein [Sphingobacterium]|uniref:DUF4231 domain-containing protein n=1 Tax=Sphingobacterium TaxID=28453 RepID=UPI0025807D46|nr:MULTISPECIES: DUF4231 domain-containing protein [Sphingobacterium]